MNTYHQAVVAPTQSKRTSSIHEAAPSPPPMTIRRLHLGFLAPVSTEAQQSTDASK